MRKVYLEGILGDKFGYEWNLNVATVGEAISAISSQRQGFRSFLLDDKGAQGYEILFGKENGVETAEELSINLPSTQSISIVPVIGGSKSGGIFMVLAGVVLIAATGGLGFAGLPAFTGTAAATGGTASIGAMAAGAGVLAPGSLAGASAMVSNLGMGLVLGGVSMMLAPKVPDSTAGAKQAENYLFNGAINNVKQGTPVPLVYGRNIVGSTTISASLFSSTSRKKISRNRKLVGISDFRTAGSEYGENSNTVTYRWQIENPGM